MKVDYDVDCKLCRLSDKQIPLLKKQKPLTIFMENITEVSRAFLSKDGKFWATFLFLSSLFAFLGWCGFSILSFYAVEVFTKERANIIQHVSVLKAIIKQKIHFILNYNRIFYFEKSKKSH